MFSKVYERYVHNSLIPFVDNFLSVFISAYGQFYSSNLVLTRLIESWKQSLDKNKFVRDKNKFVKAFDCIPRDF